MEFSENERYILKFFRDFMEHHGAGESIFLCGGFIRDKLLKKVPQDVDVVVQSSSFSMFKTYATQNQRSLNLKNLSVKLRDYGIMKGIEVVEFEYEDLKLDIRKFEGEIYQDLATRDFTVNALYYNVWTNSVVDYVGGVDDLKSKVLKVVNNFNDTFVQDYSRFLRLARFREELDFTVEKELEEFLEKVAYSKIVIPEKYCLNSEFKKILRSPKRNSILDRLVKMRFIDLFVDQHSTWIKDWEILEDLKDLWKKIQIVFDEPFFASFLEDYLENNERMLDVPTVKYNLMFFSVFYVLLIKGKFREKFFSFRNFGIRLDPRQKEEGELDYFLTAVTRNKPNFA